MYQKITRKICFEKTVIVLIILWNIRALRSTSFFFVFHTKADTQIYFLSWTKFVYKWQVKTLPYNLTLKVKNYVIFYWYYKKCFCVLFVGKISIYKRIDQEWILWLFVIFMLLCSNISWAVFCAFLTQNFFVCSILTFATHYNMILLVSLFIFLITCLPICVIVLVLLPGLVLWVFSQSVHITL